jgi:hypothetical protein
MKIFYAVTTPIGEAAFVRVGERGYYPCTTERQKVYWEELDRTQSRDDTNAALAGSMFGWDCPAAKALQPV